MRIASKRVYEPASKEDGFRVLVDRMWPRGVSREEAAVDLWAKELAPTTELRKWFNHDPGKWEAFREKYKTELEENGAAVRAFLQDIRDKGAVTLIYGAKDTQHNQAVVLLEVLETFQ